MSEINDVYTNFIDFLNENLVRLQSYKEELVQLRGESSNLLLQAAIFFNPEILSGMNSLEEQGRKCDQIIIEGQSLTSEIERHLDEVVVGRSALKYYQPMKDAGLVEKGKLEMEEDFAPKV